MNYVYITNKKSPTKRREVLKAVGATGAGLTTIGQASATDDGVEIDTVRHRGKVLESKRVPKQWYQHQTRVDSIAADLARQYEDTPAVGGVGRTATERRVAGRRVTRPVVYTTESAEGVSIPSKRDGIAIERREIPDVQPEVCYDQDYDSVPGGAQVETGVPFSATCRVTNSNGDPRLMTCAHGFKRCEGSIEGDELTQSGRLIGGVEDWSIGQDWATVSLDSSSPILSFDSRLVGTQREVRGHVTKSGIDDLLTTDEIVYHRGNKTCETSGQVADTGIPQTQCENTSNEAYSSFVRYSTPTEAGDSGGIHYKEFSYNGTLYASVISPHYGSGADYSYGTAAYKINNNHGINFG